MNAKFATDDKLAAARGIAIEAYPFLAKSLLSVTPVIVDHPAMTLATDEQWRLYHNPESEWYKGISVEELAGVWIHEVAHLDRDHPGRASIMGITKVGKELFAANKFMDARINDDILADRLLPLPKKGSYTKDMGLPPGRAWEEDFVEWRDRQEEQQQPQSGGKGDTDSGNQDKNQSAPANGQSEGEPQTPASGNDGSGATGVPREWELGPASDNAPGLNEDEAEMVRDQTARDIQQAKAVGTVPGSWQRYAEDRLKVKVDPRKQIRAVVSHSVSAIIAARDDISYRRPNRRGAAFEPFIRPGLIGYNPKVCIIIDTSGSMGGDELRSALSAIDNSVKALGESVEVIAGDTRAASCMMANSSRKVSLAGGGGTDMGAIMRHVDARRASERPDLLIVVTDGYTPWPQKRLKTKCLAVALRTTSGMPDWLKRIDLSGAKW